MSLITIDDNSEFPPYEGSLYDLADALFYVASDLGFIPAAPKRLCQSLNYRLKKRVPADMFRQACEINGLYEDLA